ncbi:hypothetical protein [Glaciimonas sp. PCH181]|uniref:hypothetical protein n=1 Tax=Glaciimonas sp. PCH181 TaxID=2133943 RepID=UPI000D3B9767|nr:hypothetical protein [Glaciimonas sp. PCH181]PUA16930.1 hypothetical protein C7W93_13180 [Glaciimonas sp. PCH181]
MTKTSDLDLPIFCEKVIAMEVLLQVMCTNLSQKQSAMILERIQQYKEHAISVASEEEVPVISKVFSQLSNFEEILARFPPKPLLH